MQRLILRAAAGISLLLAAGCSPLAPDRNVRPIAVFELQRAPQEIQTAEFQVLFNASQSSDDSEVCLHKWDFGDGTTEIRRVGCSSKPETHQSTNNITHQYRTQRGTFIVTLTVVDDDNEESMPAKLTLALRSNRYPIADFGVSTDPSDGRLVTFNASTSTDPDPEDQGLLFFTWNFGDGGATGSSRNPVIQHLYQQDRRYNVTLTVEDTLGFQSSITKIITVRTAAATTIAGGER